jgi:penicillin-binding protein 2
MRNLQPFQGWRLTFFQGVIVAVFMIFAIRMYDLQVVNYEVFKAEADENRFSQLPIPSDRGVIYDRNGKPLASNAPAYIVEITPAELPADQAGRYQIYNRLSALVDVPPTISAELVNGERIRSIERIVREVEGIAPFRPIAVAADVDRRVAMRIREEAITLPGVSIRTIAVREYPTGELTSHIVGYMGPIGPEEAERLRELGYDPAFDRVGYDGIERYLEADLAGVRGSILREVDVVGEELKQVSFIPPKAGKSVVLTIDTELQAAARQALIDGIGKLNGDYGTTMSETGVVVAMNPNTGEILAMVSYPEYDNSRFARAIDGEYYLEVLNNPLTPLVNHTTGSLYPPGSAWKLITAAAVLEEKIIDPSYLLFDEGDIVLENRYAPNDPAASQRFVCHFREGHKNVNMIGAIAQSCNVYFYQVGGGNPEVSEFALRPGGLGIENLIRYAHALGVGSELGVQLPGEIAGRMPDPDWKRIIYGENWSTGDTYNAAFGQGYITVTPLQLISSVQAIVTGEIYQPTLVREFLDEEGNAIAPFEPIVARTISLDRAEPDGTITLRLIEDMFIKGADSLSCTCEPDSDFYNPLRCPRDPSTYRAEADVNLDKNIYDPRPYRVHIPYGYTFNGGVCNRSRFDPDYVPAFLSEENLRIVRQGMRATITVGTAQAANLDIVRFDGLPVEVAGKTGTAEYCDNIAWERRLCKPGDWPAHAWFAAYTPWDNPANDDPLNPEADRDTPELLVIAMIYNGEEGSGYALPVVNEVISAYYRLQQERNNPTQNVVAQAP